MNDLDVGTWMLVLFAFALAILLGTGLLQFFNTGDVFALARRIGITLVLLTFSVGFYLRWRE